VKEEDEDLVCKKATTTTKARESIPSNEEDGDTVGKEVR